MACYLCPAPWPPGPKSNPLLASHHNGGSEPGANTTMVDRFIARHNIEHFRELISKETDEGKLKTLRRLLAEEEAKLKRAIEEHRKETD